VLLHPFLSERSLLVPFIVCDDTILLILEQ